MYTQEQQQVIEHRGGHAKVDAVAGSGKTTTMIGRVGHLLDQGTDPSRILVLMFNRDAREQFQAKLKDKLGPKHNALPETRTFHSIALKLINLFVEKGHLPDWKLESRGWVREKMARQVIKQAENDNVVVPGTFTLDDFIAYLDLRKATLDPKHVYLQRFPANASLIFDQFEELREQSQIRFFEDLLSDLALLIQSRPGDTQAMTNKMDHIIVDEFQDTNHAQMIILRALAGTRAKVMVVGDPSQTIYQWRGAEPMIMHTQFEREYPDTTSYHLSRTFRFGHRLSLMANQSIVHNTVRSKHLCVSAKNNPDTRIEVVEEKRNATHPSGKILTDWLKSGRSLSDVMVLNRLWAFSMPVEIECLINKIPYRMDEGYKRSFFARQEIKALFGFLHLANGTLFDHPDIKTLIENMAAFPTMFLKENQKTAFVRDLLNSDGSLNEAFARLTHSANGYMKQRIQQRLSGWIDISLSNPTDPAAGVLDDIYDRLDLFKAIELASRTDEEEMQQRYYAESLLEFAERQELSLRQFLDLCSRLQEEAFNQTGDGDRVTLTTIHRAKGLEAPLVIIPNLSEGSFPYYSENIELDEESERRLYYVAITRAIERLVVCVPCAIKGRQTLQGQPWPDTFEPGMPARFLYESQLMLSDAVGGALYERKKPDTDFYATPEVADAYLKEVGIDFKCQTKPYPPPKKSSSVSKGKSRAASGALISSQQIQQAQQRADAATRRIEKANTPTVKDQGSKKPAPMPKPQEKIAGRHLFGRIQKGMTVEIRNSKLLWTQEHPGQWMVDRVIRDHQKQHETIELYHPDLDIWKEISTEVADLHFVE